MENLLTVPVIRKAEENKKNKFERKLVIVKTSDLKSVLFLEEIGPLEPMDQKQ